MRIVLCLAVLLVLCTAQVSLGADTLTNIRRPTAPAAPAPQGLSRVLVPGTVVRLPDGRQTRILEVTPQGIVTDLGVTLTPEGAVAEGGATTPVTVVEPAEATREAPESATVAPEAARTDPAASPEAGRPEGPQVQPVPETQKSEPGAVVVPETAVTPRQTTPVTPTAPETAPHQLTIVELLPLTPAPGEPKAEKAAEKKEPEQKAASEKKPEEKKPVPVKEQKPKEQKPKKEEKPREKPAQPAKKPTVGEELRIPPEAVSTGNLDFLEGCWQGTRPEYYSKRMIKECFCFDVHGGAGKRRVIDSIGGRMCIGSSKAKLSKEGVLSVTSSGAACTDGERWGQAEMVCKGTGQRAPCTWVFKDAQGGRQSYEIPFVRVESCGR